MGVGFVAYKNPFLHVLQMHREQSVDSKLAVIDAEIERCQQRLRSAVMNTQLGEFKESFLKLINLKKRNPNSSDSGANSSNESPKLMIYEEAIKLSNGVHLYIDAAIEKINDLENTKRYIPLKDEITPFHSNNSEGILLFIGSNCESHNLKDITKIMLSFFKHSLEKKFRKIFIPDFKQGGITENSKETNELGKGMIRRTEYKYEFFLKVENITLKFFNFRYVYQNEGSRDESIESLCYSCYENQQAPKK